MNVIIDIIFYILVLVEKLGDIKQKKSAGDALMAFSEKISLQFVLSQGI